jgi:hypothetical protein
VEGSWHPLISYCLPLFLCLAGFHGVFFARGPWRKTAAWLVFQAGLGLFLLILSRPGNAFCLSRLLLLLGSTSGVGAFLAALCAKLSAQPEGARRRRSP